MRGRGPLRKGGEDRVLEAIDLRGGYGGQEVLHGVSCGFSPGEVTVLLGPNGCGKSTLLRCLAGLMSPASGQVLLDGARLDSLTPQARARRIAVLPQSRDVPALTARGMVLHGRWPHLRWPRVLRAEDRAAADAALARVGLSDRADAALATLSGGQRQKVYLAMLLCQDTDVLLLDEPTTFLDVGCQLDTWLLSRELAEAGRTVGVVSHELGQGLRYASRCHVLQEGRLAGSGTPRELFESGILRQVFGVELARHGDDYLVTGKMKEEIR